MFCKVLYMLLRYRYRLEPTPGQRIALAKVFGCARVVFNDGLRRYEKTLKDELSGGPA
jgi:hypothetical protein